MARCILVIGASGSGKSRSIKNFTKDEVGIFKCVKKDLPFRNNLGQITTQDYNVIKAGILKSNKSVFIIDDANYLMTNEFFYSTVGGYEKFSNIGTNFYDLINFLQNAVDDNKTVYILMHEEVNDITGSIKPKTIGKMLDEKVAVEGLFTIVLRCVNIMGKHSFFTNDNGCAKSPEDMFPTQEIENDLKYVDNIVREYYGIQNTTNVENKEENN